MGGPFSLVQYDAPDINPGVPILAHSWQIAPKDIAGQMREKLQALSFWWHLDYIMLWYRSIRVWGKAQCKGRWCFCSLWLYSAHQFVLHVHQQRTFFSIVMTAVTLHLCEFPLRAVPWTSFKRMVTLFSWQADLKCMSVAGGKGPHLLWVLGISHCN